MSKQEKFEQKALSFILVSLTLFALFIFDNAMGPSERKYTSYVNYGDLYSEKDEYGRCDNTDFYLPYSSDAKSLTFEENVVKISGVGSQSGGMSSSKRSYSYDRYTAFFDGRNDEKLCFEFYHDYATHLPDQFISSSDDDPLEATVYYIVDSEDRTVAYGFNKSHVEKELERLQRIISPKKTYNTNDNQMFKSP